MVKPKSLFPSDFRDILSIISLIGFIGIFMNFTLNNPLISESMDALFLIFAGVGLMIVGKVFTIPKWARDGIQSNELSLLLAITFGLASMIIGFMLLFGLTIPLSLVGFIGVLALVPAIFILFDYLSKNK